MEALIDNERGMMNAEERIRDTIAKVMITKIPVGFGINLDEVTKAILSIDPKELIKYSFCGTVEYPTVNIEWKE